MTKEIEEYAKKAIKKGFHKKHVKKSLRNAGHSRSMIKQAFKNIEKELAELESKAEQAVLAPAKPKKEKVKKVSKAKKETKDKKIKKEKPSKKEAYKKHPLRMIVDAILAAIVIAAIGFLMYLVLLPVLLNSI